MRRHARSYHGGQRKRIHVCPFCYRSNPKTYSTFHDRRKHIEMTHPTCRVGGDDDPLFVERYATGFKLDGWYRFHGITVSANLQPLNFCSGECGRVVQLPVPKLLVSMQSVSGNVRRTHPSRPAQSSSPEKWNSVTRTSSQDEGQCSPRRDDWTGFGGLVKRRCP